MVSRRKPRETFSRCPCLASTWEVLPLLSVKNGLKRLLTRATLKEQRNVLRQPPVAAGGFTVNLLSSCLPKCTHHRVEVGQSSTLVRGRLIAHLPFFKHAESDNTHPTFIHIKIELIELMTYYMCYINLSDLESDMSQLQQTSESGSSERSPGQRTLAA